MVIICLAASYLLVGHVGPFIRYSVHHNDNAIPLALVVLRPPPNPVFVCACQVYCEMYGDLSPKELGKRLWGDAWVDPNTRAFRKGFPPPDCQRTFVQFILEPMYKIYSQVGG